MYSIGETIAKNRKNMKMSQSDLAAALTKNGLPIKFSTISSWEKETNQINANFFLEICKILNISDIYGEFIGNNPNSPFAGLNERGMEKLIEYASLLRLSEDYKLAEPTIIPFTRSIALYNLPVSAGTGEFLDSDDYEMIDAPAPDAADFALRINGDSMTPMFTDGQIVYIKKSSELKNGEIGIFYLNGNAYIKKLERKKKNVRLISLNQAYAPINVNTNDSFKIFGRVLS